MAAKQPCCEVKLKDKLGQLLRMAMRAGGWQIRSVAALDRGTKGVDALRWGGERLEPKLRRSAGFPALNTGIAVVAKQLGKEHGIYTRMRVYASIQILSGLSLLYDFS
ncbi:MAG: hypothetical protein JWN34_1476 [Bryobacterales bacterium]|nr:hypothetical protein [Bryobacterales bacterium]